MLQLKKTAPDLKSFDGTVFFKWLSYPGKLYVGLVVLIIGIVLQGVLVTYSVLRLEKEITDLKKSNQRVTVAIQSLNELSPVILSRCQSGLLGGTNLEVSDILAKLNQQMNSLEIEPGGAEKKPLIERYSLLNNRLQEYGNLSLSKPKYYEIKRLYDQYSLELTKLEKNQAFFYQSHLREPFYHQLWIWGLWLVVLILLFLVVWDLFYGAGVSITKPAKILTAALTTESEQIFKMEIAITSKEGLGKAGLLFKDSFSYWDKKFAESTQSIHTFEALCKEFATEIRKTELYTIQVQKVAELIVETTDEQERVIGEANTELEYLNDHKTNSQKIPNQMKGIIDELKHQLNLSETQTYTILQKPVEYQDESNEIADLAANLESTSAKINVAIKVLEEVAERSELLAFNTAIQAARAGEKGMGFGVVAKEIAKLVERSKHASTRLSELLYHTQEKNKEILAVIHHKAADTAGVYEAVGEICSGIFQSTRKNFELIANLTKVMESIILMVNDLSKETSLIANLPQDGMIQNNFEAEILDYQLNVQEANRVATIISEISEELRILTETKNNHQCIHY